MKKKWLLLLFCATFLVVKVLNISPKISDENLYFYAASLIVKGIFPYRDFFIANLPGQILFYAGLIKLFGFNLVLLKLVQVALVLGSALLLFKVVKERASELAGIFASGFFLSSSVVLGASDFAVGVNEAVFLLVLSWYFVFKEKPQLAGVVLFLGLLIRQYILPAALGIAVYELFKGKKREAAEYLLYSIGLFALVNILLLGLYGEGFISPVWRYHFLKPSSGTRSKAMLDFIKGEKFLIAIALVSGFMFLRRAFKGWKIVNHKWNARQPKYIKLGLASVFAFLVHFAFLNSFSSVFLIYFVVLIPFLAVLGALALDKFVPKRSRKLGLVFVVLVFILNTALYQRNLSGKYRFEALDQVVSDVVALTSKQDKIFGAYLETPLVAILSGREVIDYQADTNGQRFTSGLMTSQEATRLATSSSIFLQSVAINQEGEVWKVDPAFVDSSTVVEFCKPLKQYKVDHDFAFNGLVLWECRGEAEG